MRFDSLYKLCEKCPNNVPVTNKLSAYPNMRYSACSKNECPETCDRGIIKRFAYDCFGNDMHLFNVESSLINNQEIGDTIYAVDIKENYISFYVHADEYYEVYKEEYQSLRWAAITQYDRYGYRVERKYYEFDWFVGAQYIESETNYNKIVKLTYKIYKDED